MLFVAARGDAAKVREQRLNDRRPLQVAQPEKLCHDPSSPTSFDQDNP